MKIQAGVRRNTFQGFFLLLGIALGLTLSVRAVASAREESRTAGPPQVVLAPVAGGFSVPVEIANTGVMGDERLFVVELSGRIKIIDAGGSVLSPAFLNIQDRITSGGEQGLLGLAFDPGYAQNGYFFVNYTDDDGDTRISRFMVDPGNPDQALPDSEYVVLTVDQPASNHNGGDLAFGPDGYLYIPLGDGGGGGDPDENAQDPGELLGKILRINVSNPLPPLPAPADQVFLPYVSGPGMPYLIPDDNPFVDDPNTRDEIWALGLRNPWRISFDRATGDLYIGDVGQDTWEEIDFQPDDSEGGENYGWDCYEANESFEPAGCGPMSDYTFPAYAYDQDPTDGEWGIAVTGGYVYRGSNYPSLLGTYFFSDYGSGLFWSMRDTGGSWQVDLLGDLGAANPTSFGEDIHGELYVADLGNGMVSQIQAAP